jgi:hypothetical protein
MKEDKNITDNLQLLDTILDYLINCEGYENNIILLINNIYHLKLKEQKSSNMKSLNLGQLIDTLLTREDRNEKRVVKLKEALIYLDGEKLIKVAPNNSIKLTYQGIIQYSNGYLNTHNLKKSNAQRLQNVEVVQKFHLKWMTFLTSLIAVGTLVVAAYYIFEILSLHVCICK